MLELGKKAPDFELPDQNGEMPIPPVSKTAFISASSPRLKPLGALPERTHSVIVISTGSSIVKGTTGRDPRVLRRSARASSALRALEASTMTCLLYTSVRRDDAAPHAVVRSRRPDCQRHGRRYRRQDRDL